MPFLVWTVIASAWAANVAAYPPGTIGSVTTTTMAGARERSAARVKVELDIFSGMPNPTWILSDAEADSFVKQLAAASGGSAGQPPGNLGYRGFIVQVTREPGVQSIRIHGGAIEISNGGTAVHARDEGRRLERWLLNTGKPHLEDELFRTAEGQF